MANKSVIYKVDSKPTKESVEKYNSDEHIFFSKDVENFMAAIEQEKEEKQNSEHDPFARFRR